MPKTAVRIGPEDNGQAMSLEDFDHAVGAPGYNYELGRGVIVVSEIPNPGLHFRATFATQRQLWAYVLKGVEKIYVVSTGSDCKVLLERFESERHPDVAVYKTPPPSEDSSAWSTWIPELVIEVVSQESESRDYDEKRDEYLSFGVHEYWIIDPGKRQMLALRRWRGTWDEHIVRPPKKYKTPLLPGLSFDCGAVFDAK